MYKPQPDPSPEDIRRNLAKQNCFFEIVHIYRARVKTRGRVVGKWDAYAVADRWLRAHWEEEK